MKKYFWFAFVILIQCKTPYQENKTEIPKIIQATFHQEIGGLKNSHPQYVFEVVFSQPFSEDFQVINFEVNGYEKKVTPHSTGKITFSENTTQFQKEDTVLNFIAKINFKKRPYHVEGVFQKKNTMYRP